MTILWDDGRCNGHHQRVLYTRTNFLLLKKPFVLPHKMKDFRCKKKFVSALLFLLTLSAKLNRRNLVILQKSKTQINERNSPSLLKFNFSASVLPHFESFLFTTLFNQGGSSVALYVRLLFLLRELTPPCVALSIDFQFAVVVIQTVL